MNNPFKNYPFNRKWAKISLKDSPRCRISVSTKMGDLLVDWGDNSPIEKLVINKNVGLGFSTTGVITSKGDLTEINHDYSVNFTGDVKITSTAGLSDIYTIKINDWVRYIGLSGQNVVTRWNLDNTFLKQFPEIKYFHLGLYFYTGNAGYTAQSIRGDWSNIPDSLELLSFHSVNTSNVDKLHININNFPPTSKLKYLNIANIDGSPTTTNSWTNVYGNLSNLPSGIVYFRNDAVLGSGYTYTGKIFPTNMERFSFTQTAMSKDENDHLLNDLAVPSTWTGSQKIVSVTGSRSLNSDIAVNSLTSKTVTVTPSTAS